MMMGLGGEMGMMLTGGVGRGVTEGGLMMLMGAGLYYSRYDNLVSCVLMMVRL